MIRTISIGSRVQHIDGNGAGKVIRLIGQPRVAGGVHARVLWDNGGSSVVRLDLLRKV